MKQVSFGFQEIASVKSASNDRLFSGDCFGKTCPELVEGNDSQ